jgi:ABC-type transport system involved in multi-copper enzyme maturation permease subunit
MASGELAGVMIMKELIGFELKKTIRRPVVIGVFIAMLVIDLLLIFLGTFPSEPTRSISYSREEVIQLRQEQSAFAGAIDDIWTQRIKDMKNGILNNPANQVNEAERKRITEELLAQGLSRAAINSPDNIVRFIREDVLHSRELQRLEDPEVASNFYKYVDQVGKETAKYYRETYAGPKGEALASKAEEMYGYLSNEYEAYYDYDWGWSRLHAMQTVLPFTIGLLLIVALAPIFSYEYSKTTDSLLLSAKYGKSKLVKAKIIVGFSLAIFSWLLMQFINIAIVFCFFGIAGSESFVQNWVMNKSPYAFTYLTSYLAVTAISFVGLLFLTSMLLLISSRSKTPFKSLIIGAVIVLLPTVRLDIFASRVVQKILMFFPTNILIGVHHFKTFEAFYLFGKVIMLPSAAMVVAGILSTLMVIGACYSFSQHQVEN